MPFKGEVTFANGENWDFSDKGGTKKKTEEIMGNGETDLSEIYFLVCFK